MADTVTPSLAVYAIFDSALTGMSEDVLEITENFVGKGPIGAFLKIFPGPEDRS